MKFAIARQYAAIPFRQNDPIREFCAKKPGDLGTDRLRRLLSLGRGEKKRNPERSER